MGLLKDVSIGRSDLWKIPLENIAGCINIRQGINKEHVDFLAQSISEIGQKEPVTVSTRKNEVYIVKGEHRFRAIKRANEVYGASIEAIIAIPEARYQDDALRIVDQLQENDTLPLLPGELAVAYKKLIDYGWSIDRIAKSTGRDKKHVRGHLSLLECDPDLKEQVNDGKISITAVSHVAKAPIEKQKEIAEKAKAGRMSQGEVRQAIGKGGRVSISVKMATDRFDGLIDKYLSEYTDGIVRTVLRDLKIAVHNEVLV